MNGVDIGQLLASSDSQSCKYIYIYISMLGSHYKIRTYTYGYEKILGFRTMVLKSKDLILVYNHGSQKIENKSYNQP